MLRAKSGVGCDPSKTRRMHHACLNEGMGGHRPRLQSQAPSFDAVHMKPSEYRAHQRTGSELTGIREAGAWALLAAVDDMI
jgi:hypothetical protein